MSEEGENVEEEDSAFSVNDWDIEQSILNLVVSLVQQRTLRMDEEIARESVVQFLNSLIIGLEAPTNETQDKINQFIQQRTED